MKKYIRTLASIFIVLGSFATANAQQRSPVEVAREDIDILCSDTLAGRGYIDSGAVRTAYFLAEQFEKMGLQPVSGMDSTESYRHPFPLKVHVISHAALTIDNKVLSLGTDFIPSSLSNSGKVSGKVIDLGYGLSEITQKISDQIIVIREGWPEEIAHNDSLKAIYSEKQRIWDRINPLLVKKPAAILILKDKLTAGFTLDPYPLPILDIQTDSFPDTFQQAEVLVAGSVETLTQYNVLGYLPGTQYPDSFLVVTAHYDHLGRIGAAIFPGANDNASGTAMLLSLARYFSHSSHRLPYSLLFIAFGGEETGLQGSRYLAVEQPIIPLSRISFLLNLDLMGNGTKGIMTVGGRDYPEYYEKLKNMNEELDAVPVVSARPNAPNSDHYFFLKQGVPGFFVFTMGGPPHYHDVNDTSQNLLLSKFTEVRTLLIHFLQSF